MLFRSIGQRYADTAYLRRGAYAATAFFTAISHRGVNSSATTKSRCVVRRKAWSGWQPATILGLVTRRCGVVAGRFVRVVRVVRIVRGSTQTIRTAPTTRNRAPCPPKPTPRRPSYHIQKKRRAEFTEEWRNYRQAMIRKDDVRWCRHRVGFVLGRNGKYRAVNGRVEP